MARAQAWRDEPHTADKEGLMELLEQVGYTKRQAADFREVLLMCPPAQHKDTLPRFQFMVNNPRVPVTRVIAITTTVIQHLESNRE